MKKLISLNYTRGQKIFLKRLLKNDQILLIKNWNISEEIK